MSHTPEPWITDDPHQIFAPAINEYVAITDVERDAVPLIDAATVAANARRIVAAVNACEGMDTESLESIAGRIAAKSVLQMHANYVSNKAKVAAMEQQRDKLLAALTEIAELDILKYHHAYAIAKGAIEEVEGQS